MKLEDGMSPVPGFDWDRAAKAVADDMDIDEHGMTRQRVNILIRLAKEGPISKARICDVAACKSEELEKFVMPALLTSTEDHEAIVTVCSRGYAITDAGLEALKIRGFSVESTPVSGIQKRLEN
jgi:hypothetical protein